MSDAKVPWWRSLLKTSSLIGLSKIAGFARDLLVAAYFGTTKAADAFNFAYLFTGNIFILLGGLNGPFHSATVSGLSHIKANAASPQETTKKQNQFLSQILINTALVFLVLSSLLWLLLQPILGLILRAQASLIFPTFFQSQIMLPVFAVSGVVGILLGAVSYHGDYFWPSLSPLVSSLALILFIVFGYQFFGAWVLGLGTALGALLQLLVQLLDLFKIGFRFSFNFAPSLPTGNVAYFNHMLFPALLSSTIGSLNVYVDSFFCAGLEPGSWTAILVGNRLIQLPFGILVGASLVSFLPRIAELKNSRPQFVACLNRETINLFILLVPVAALLLALAGPGVQLLFQRGAFDQNSTRLVQVVLWGLGLSLLTALPREVYTRAFYAVGDSKTPLYVSLVSIVWNAILDWWLGDKFGVMGIALSTTITAFINSVLLMFLLKRQLPEIKTDWLKICLLLLSGLIIFVFSRLVYDWLIAIVLFKQSIFGINLNILLACSVASLLGLGLYFVIYKSIDKYFYKVC
jgi:putative peptidoglycan lipid II flippase